jgi:hypothetical protein
MRLNKGVLAQTSPDRLMRHDAVLGATGAGKPGTTSASPSISVARVAAR